MNNTLKTLLTAGLLSSAAFSEIAINDNFKIGGFFDMSSTYKVSKDSAGDNETAFGASFDQFEIDFMYDFKNGVSARADLNSLAGGSFDLEQAFITTPLAGSPVTLTLGKFLSSTGFECAEPVCLYQYSTSKALQYGGYQNGFNLNYGTPVFNLYGAVVGSIWDGTDTDLKKPGLEAQVSIMPMEGVTAKVAYATDLETSDGVENKSLTNAWVMGKFGQATVAGEFNYLMNWDAKDNNGISYLAMVRFDVNSVFGVTGRYSALKLDDMDNTDNEVTLSPSVIFNPNWSALAEVKYEIDLEITTVALETIYTF